jgi:hypothetical protein
MNYKYDYTILSDEKKCIKSIYDNINILPPELIKNIIEFYVEKSIYNYNFTKFNGDTPFIVINCINKKEPVYVYRRLKESDKDFDKINQIYKKVYVNEQYKLQLYNLIKKNNYIIKKEFINEILYNDLDIPFLVFVTKFNYVEKLFEGMDLYKGFHGNTILLQLKHNKYVYIGGNGGIIISFKTKIQINNYISLLGNSSVPYSFAKSDNKIIFIEPEEDNTINIIEKKELEKYSKIFNIDNIDENIYSIYYKYFDNNNEQKINSQSIPINLIYDIN